ncbi:hypothetical protein INR49_009467 [Caranx melampygus]|nr:hypothetical protein INR49_009467 [Caranx melampygus]
MSGLSSGPTFLSVTRTAPRPVSGRTFVGKSLRHCDKTDPKTWTSFRPSPFWTSCSREPLLQSHRRMRQHRSEHHRLTAHETTCAMRCYSRCATRTRPGRLQNKWRQQQQQV